MINQDDKLKIIELSQKYKINQVFLFGSSVSDIPESNDIDIAVKGLNDSQFFKFYSELIFNLSKPVDVIDLENKTKLNEIVLDEGLKLYG